MGNALIKKKVPVQWYRGTPNAVSYNGVTELAVCWAAVQGSESTARGLCFAHSAVCHGAEAVTLNEWAWALQCFNRALFIDTDTWISYNFHVQWNIILLILFNHEKCTKTIVHSWAVQKQELGQAWPKEFSLPTPILAWLGYRLSWDQICCWLSLV